MKRFYPFVLFISLTIRIAAVPVPDSLRIFAPGLNMSERATMLYSISDSLFNISMRTAESFIESVYRRAESDRDTAMMAAALQRKGSVYMEVELYSEAYREYQRSLNLYERANYPSGKYNVITSLGTLHYFLGDMTRAIRYCMEAKDFIDKNPNVNFYWNKLTNLHLNLGSMYGSENRFELAREEFMKALEAYHKDPDRDSITRAYIYNNIASTYMNNKETEKGLTWARVAFELKLKYGRVHDLRDAWLNYAEVVRFQGNDKGVMECLHRSLSYCDTLNPSSDLLKVLVWLVKEYEKKGDYRNAFRYFKLHDKCKMKLDNDGKIARIKQEELKYEFRNQFVNDSIHHVADMRVKDAEISKKRTQSVLGSTCLVIVSIFGVIAYRRYRMTQRQKKEIEEKNRIIEGKNKDITDSILYAKRIQATLMTSAKYIAKNLERLKDRT